MAGQVAVDVLSQPAVDSKTMSCRFLISTDAIDRDKMAVRQEGIRLDYYQLNPVVLYGHGMEGIVLPIAMSEDDEGSITVQREGNHTYARAFHKPSDKVSSQMYDAVSCGLLRAASVGITPKACSVMYDAEGAKVPIIDECMLNEWSYCAIGVNPEAVVKSMGGKSKVSNSWLEAYALQSDAALRILERGTLDGSPIDPVIRKSLSQLRPVATGSGVGFNFGEKKMLKSLTSQEVKSMNARQLMKACASMESYDDKTKSLIKSAAGFGEPETGDEKKDEEKPEEKPAETPAPSTDSSQAAADSLLSDSSSESSDDKPVGTSEEVKKEEPKAEEDKPDPAPGEMPLSAKVLTNLHGDLKELISTAEAAMKPVENPDVVKKVTQELDRLRDCVASIEGFSRRLIRS